MAGSAGLSATSSNLGVTWTNLATLVGTPTINAFQSPLSSVLFAGASDEVVYRNVVGSWILPNVKPQVGTVPLAMSFTDSSNGWCVNSPAPFTGGVFTTATGGSSWARLYVHTKWPLRGIWMSPSVPGLGYVVGDNGTILKTTTGGQ